MGKNKAKRNKQATAAKSSPQAIEHYDRAVVLHDNGNLSGAESAYRVALAINRDFAEAHNNLGNVLKDMGKWKQALDEYRAALKLYPNHPLILNNIGNALHHTGKTEQAINTLRRVIELQPEYPDPYNHLGMALCSQQRYDEAIQAYQRAIELDPHYAEAYNNLGSAFRDSGEFEQAAKAYEQALELKPDIAVFHKNAADLIVEKGKGEDAIPYYQRALELEPDDLAVAASLFHRLQQICDWQALEPLRNRINALFLKLKKGKECNLSAPFEAISRTDDLYENFVIARAYSGIKLAYITSQKKTFPAPRKKQQRNQLRIGYLSNDFYDHATVHLMLGVFREHNRDRIKINTYSYGEDDHSESRKKIIEYSDSFVDISEYSDIDAARKIFDDQIDILVDLKGYTKGTRLEICAFRPAPIQATYLGFPGTSGADFFDYVLTDQIVTPLAHEAFYSEKFAWLPDTYQCTDNQQKISPKVYSRSNFGLPDDGLVFCSFNQPYKIDAAFYDIWMRVLKTFDNSVLWLIESSDTAKKNLRHEAEIRDVDHQRIIFAGKIPKDEHLARTRLADLALDTRIYNGHTTTSDALWAGVPVVAMQGRHFASRVSSSLLQAISLPELVTHSLEDYEALIKHLASNLDELIKIRQKLQRNRDSQPLFDTEKFTHNLEQAYRTMWDKYARGDKSDHFDVADVS